MRKIIYLGCLLLLPLMGVAQDLKMGVLDKDQKQVKESIHAYQLKNGLKLIVKPDHRFPTVVSQIWYKVGSGYEHGGITGISHALEHMMYRGTKAYPNGKFMEMITEHGGILNASTSEDYTFYYELLPAHHLDISLKLEADRMRNLLLDKALFEKEMKAVQEERRLRVDDVPEMLLFERFSATAYISSPYHHSVIGWKNDLDHMTVEDLRQWYRNWYAPNNATIVIVGDVDPKKTYKLVKRYFQRIPSKSLPVVKPQREIPPLGKQKVVVNAPAKLPFLIVGYPVPSLVTAKDPKTAYALLVLSKLLSGGESSRLVKDLVRQKQIAVSAESYYRLYLRQDGLFMLYGMPAQGQSVKKIKEAFLAHVKDLRQNLVDSGELDRVKSLTIAEDVFGKDSMIQQAVEIGILESIGLSYQQAGDYVKQVESVTPEDVRRVAQKYLKPDRMTVGILNPLPISQADAAIKAPRADIKTMGVPH